MCPAEDIMPAGAEKERRTVLVVEDEVLIRLTLADDLRARGYLVLEAANGAEARDTLLAGVNVDLIISDINMPGELDGLGLARWVAENEVEAPLILTSGLTSALDQARAESPHVKLFVPKPYNNDEVAAHIAALLRA